MDKEQVPDLFTVTFVGEYLEIICKFQREMIEETEHGVYREIAPGVVHGYLIDFDDKYYFLGDDKRVITRCLDRSEVSYIEVIEEQNEYDKILDHMPIPGENESN
jgi:hypothetical protein